MTRETGSPRPAKIRSRHLLARLAQAHRRASNKFRLHKKEETVTLLTGKQWRDAQGTVCTDSLPLEPPS
jgi:hypothetical protein